jgi:hypothetical protein
MPKLQTSETNQTGHHTPLPLYPDYSNPSYIYDQQDSVEIYG